MSKTYLVDVPFAGYMSMEVAADSEEEAIAAAMQVDLTIDIQEGDDTDFGPEISEWDVYSSICRGNVLLVPLNEPEATEV